MFTIIMSGLGAGMSIQVRKKIILVRNIIAQQIALNKTITQNIFKEFFLNPNVLLLNKYNIIRAITYIYKEGYLNSLAGT